MWPRATRFLFALSTFAIVVTLLATQHSARAAPDPLELANLGRALFFDVTFSANRNQSCASCHDPAKAFSDGHDNGVSGAVSLGGDGVSLGDRNAPSTTYAFLIPDFQQDDQNRFLGGYFHDGRATTMVDQAGQPFVNQFEMGLADHAAVVHRVRENPAYVATFERLYGKSILDDSERAIAAISESIVAFEHTEQFAPFDSRYDRFLRGVVRRGGTGSLVVLLITDKLRHLPHFECTGIICSGDFHRSPLLQYRCAGEFYSAADERTGRNPSRSWLVGESCCR